LIAEEDDAETGLLLGNLAGEDRGPFRFGPVGGGSVGRPDEQGDFAPLEAAFDFGDEVGLHGDVELAEPSF